MAEKHVYHRGVEGRADAKGNVVRPGCKAVVVLQPGESDDPIPYMYAESEADAREYVRSMKAAGHGAGLRIVKPSDVEG